MTCIYCTDLPAGQVCDECGRVVDKPLVRKFRHVGGFDGCSHIEVYPGHAYVVGKTGKRGGNIHVDSDRDPNTNLTSLGYNLEICLNYVRSGSREEI